MVRVNLTVNVSRTRNNTTWDNALLLLLLVMGSRDWFWIKIMSFWLSSGLEQCDNILDACGWCEY